jgi:hypothetical protein
MAGKVRPIPEGYHTVTPYIICNGAAQALDYYKKAFSAEELMRMPTPEGKIMHAEIKIGDSHIMLADEFPEMDCRSPQARETRPTPKVLLGALNRLACCAQIPAARHGANLAALTPKFKWPLSNPKRRTRLTAARGNNRNPSPCLRASPPLSRSATSCRAFDARLAGRAMSPPSSRSSKR